MNWLIYIGGGWIWYLWVFATINAKIRVDKKPMGLTERLVTAASVVAVWIWICWKFIR